MLRTAFLLFGACASLAAASGVAGKWNVTAQGSNGQEYKMELVLQDEGGKLTGTMSGVMGSVAIEDVKLAGNELTYKLPVGESTYAIKVTVSGDTMKGNYTGPDGQTGAVTATREAAAAASPGGITGTWKATAESSGGRQYKLQLVLTDTGGTLGGTLSNEEGSVNIENAKLEGSNLSFKITVDQGTYTIRLASAGDALKGTFEGPSGEKGTISATR